MTSELVPTTGVITLPFGFGSSKPEWGLIISFGGEATGTILIGSNGLIDVVFKAALALSNPLDGFKASADGWLTAGGVVFP